MLRWMMPLLIAAFAAGTAAAAEKPVAKRGAYRAAANLPAGLPRPHYKYRTTVSRPVPPPYGRPYVEEESEVLFTPSNGAIPYIPPLPGSALLPGSRAFDYDYQGPYYGGPYVSYWNRLPYACGVYGYC
jgi:hypothetical protein